MKIYIVGGPGAGKSTLARELGDRLSAPVFDLDSVLWKNGGPKSEAERAQEMAKVDAGGSWIAEGIYTESAGYLIERAEVILWIEVPLPVAVWRIVFRHASASISGDNKHPGVGRLLKFIWRATVKYRVGNRDAGASLGTERRRYTRRYLQSFRDKVIGPSPRDVRQWVSQAGSM